MNNPSATYRMSIYHKALSAVERMKMMKLLASTQGDLLSVNEIAERLKLSQATTSKHLKVLYSCGLIKLQKQNSKKYYTICNEGIAEYYQLEEALTKATYTPCNYDYQCETCPYKDRCN